MSIGDGPSRPPRVTERSGHGTIQSEPGDSRRKSVRVVSPFGPIRLDFGYNPYESLARGEVYYEGGVATEAERPLLCVTPGNTVPVTNVGTAEQPVLRQSTQAGCPATYRPPDRRGFRRWNVSIAIGQAF